ncbi:hypothetical protein [Neptuniibacter sp. QD34_54]|uniref:hypothetical protein n=1 Tax=Neptuniibacter sp. QD34_54 TaxID=3398208 RepID=UPI0039F5107F
MQVNVIKKIAAVLAVICAPIALFAGVYGFVWWKVSAAAENFAKDIAPFAAMSYQDIHIDLVEAQVGLKGISFVPTGSEGKIGVQSAVLKAPSWGFVLELEEKLSKGELPDAFNVDIKGIDINLNSGYIQDWGRIALDSQRNAGSGYDALACGGLEFIGLPEVRKMGYGVLNTDASFQYHFDSVDKELNFDLQSRTKQVANMSMSLVLKVASDALNMQSIVFAQPQLKHFEARYFDRGYNKKRNKFCAGLNKEPVKQYRERYKSLLSKRLKYEGWKIPDDLLTALDGLNAPSGSIYLRVDVPKGFGVQSLASIQTPSDLVRELNPYVEFSKKHVSLDGLDWAEPDLEGERLLEELMKPQETPEFVLGDEVQATEPVDAVAEELKPGSAIKPFPKPKPKIEYEKSFKDIDVTELEAHIGKSVILYTYFGQKVEGRLVAVTDKVITVEHRVVSGRGTATYPMAYDKIQSAQLYH